MKKILIASLIILPIQVYAVDDSILIEAASRVSAGTFSSVEAIMITDILANNENDAKTIWKYLAEDWLVKKYCGSGSKETLSCNKFTCKQITSDGADIESVDVTSKATNDLTTYCSNDFNIIKCDNNAYYATKDKSKNKNDVCPSKTKSTQDPESSQRTGGSINAATSDMIEDATKKRNFSKIKASDQQTPKQDITPKKPDANASVTQISGVIKDTAGEPLVSATVIEQDTTPPNGVSADTNGKFTLILKNTKNPDIKIEYMGYKTIVKKASEINDVITMEEDSVTLDDVVTIAEHKKGDRCGWSETEAKDAKKAGIDVAKKGTYEKYKGKWVCKPNACSDENAKISFNDGKYSCIVKRTEEPEQEAEETTEEQKSEEKQETKKYEQRHIPTDAEIADLEDRAKAAKENETSLANRAIGAAGIGATGIGGMMALSALSEQKSDDAAERDMRAYLATFRCDYGTGGNSVKGGTSNIELPGGNDMIGLYTQYATLANDLKIRKDALGIKPGIESEVVIDKAETGLYDDVGTGITGGAYASIARALQDPNGEDAKLWNEQKKKTSEKLKTGAIVAGVGAAGSLLANIAVNDIFSNKAQALKKLESNINAISQKTPSCPSGSTGTDPNCICDGNAIYNRNTITCDSCPTGQTANKTKNVCECPEDKPFWNRSSCTLLKCGDPNCDLSLDENLTVDENTCQCSCKDTNKYTYVDGKCELKERKEDQTPETITLPADSLFEFGKSDLKDEAKQALTNFATAFKGQPDESSCNLKIIGHTDRSGEPSNNMNLSKKRANAVKDYLVKQGINDTLMKTEGKGESECKCVDGGEPAAACKGKKFGEMTLDGYKYAPCRRVEIQMICAGAASSVSNAAATVTGFADDVAGKKKTE